MPLPNDCIPSLVDYYLPGISWDCVGLKTKKQHMNYLSVINEHQCIIMFANTHPFHLHGITIIDSLIK